MQNSTLPMKPADLPTLVLDDQLCFPLYAASNLIQRLYRPLLDALNLTYPQYLVMLVLWENAPLSVGILGEQLYLDSGTLTPLLKRMEKADLITRDRDPEDERRVLVGLTPAGSTLRKHAKALPANLLCRIDMPLLDLLRLRDDVRQLIVRVKAGTAEPVTPAR